ncbi:MAG: hypothetical protein JSW73_04880 [Candidatus Woesearchaeota archaeon]|nr:MAG: hypothetical protein JSW73_04880 [Candidatus Woesearchaeota archaeon]
MRKKASMLSILAYLIAIIFIAVVLYKVFTFSVEKYPAIEVRELSNEYDYALNAPENVHIPHIFPATYFEGCGIGAVLFDVNKDSEGNLVHGTHMGISRCGDGCIDYFNLMTGIMAAMLAFDTAQGVWEVATAWFAGHLVSRAVSEAFKEGMESVAQKGTREIMEEFIEEQGGSAASKYIKKKMVKSGSKSYLGKVFGTKFLKEAAEQASGEAVEKTLVKQAWQSISKQLLGESLGKKAKNYLKEKLGLLFKGVEDVVGPGDLAKKVQGEFLSESVLELFVNNPNLREELVEQQFETAALAVMKKSGKSGEAFMGAIVHKPQTLLPYDVGPGLKTLDDSINTLTWVPAVYTDDILDYVEANSVRSPTVWYAGGLDAVVKECRWSGNLDPLLDFFKRNGDSTGILTGATQDFASSGMIPNSVIRQAVIDTGDDAFQKHFVARVLAKESAEVFFTGASKELVEKTTKLSLRPSKIAKMFAKYTVGLEIKVAKAYALRVVPAGTATGAGARDAIGITFGFFEEHVLGLPHPGHFLGMCCFKTDYTTRFIIEMGQFASGLFGAVPGMSFVQAALDKLTLDIYSEEIDLCKRDIYLYSYIKDGGITPESPEFTPEKKAKRWTGLIETDTVLINYVDAPRILFLNKTIENKMDINVIVGGS